MVDLQTALNVDLSHIETKANEVARSNRHINLVLGQLITEYAFLAIEMRSVTSSSFSVMAAIHLKCLKVVHSIVFLKYLGTT